MHWGNSALCCFCYSGRVLTLESNCKLFLCSSEWSTRGMAFQWFHELKKKPMQINLCLMDLCRYNFFFVLNVFLQGHVNVISWDCFCLFFDSCIRREHHLAFKKVFNFWNSSYGLVFLLSYFSLPLFCFSWLRPSQRAATTVLKKSNQERFCCWNKRESQLR